MVSGVEFRGLWGTPGMLAVSRAVCERQPCISGLAGASNLWKEWELRSKSPPTFALPGASSDFAVFLHHLSLPVLDFGFGGGSPGGQYHTTFDDFTFVERYFDPGFKGHEAAGSLCAELLTELALRGAQSFDAVEAARALAGVARAAGKEEKEGAAWLGAERAEKLASAFDEFANACENSPERARNIFSALALPNGIPGRAWYRNRLWTADRGNGYGSETFPTLRSAASKGVTELNAELDTFVLAVRRLIPQQR